jgi:hypothetical protein
MSLKLFLLLICAILITQQRISLVKRWDDTSDIEEIKKRIYGSSEVISYTMKSKRKTAK